MISSMTGFGRYELEAHERRISVEIKAVNHRYLDLSIKMPRSFNAFESKIRNVIRDYVERGKTDIYISCEELGEDRLNLKYNRNWPRAIWNISGRWPMSSDWRRT